MGALPKTRMNVQQFFAWWENQSDGERFELVDGVVVAMGRDRIGHNLAKMRATNALRTAIERAGVDCRAFVDGVGVSPDEKNYRLPDAVVNCGPIDLESVILPNPIVVVEIVSPRSEDRDANEKLFDYFAIASMRHYLIVYVERGYVVHHRRDGDGEIHTAFVRDGRIVLDPPGLELTLAELLGVGD
jgi:Uma2 family endonuclease